MIRMAFVRVLERRRQHGMGRVAVSLVSAGSRTDRVGLRITIGSAVAASGKWSDQTRLDVSWGTGDDFGWIKLQAVPQGGRKCTPQRDFLVTDTRRLPLDELPDGEGAMWRLLQEKRPAATAEYRDLPDGSLAVQLPREWWRQTRAATLRKAAAFRGAA